MVNRILIKIHYKKLRYYFDDVMKISTKQLASSMNITSSTLNKKLRGELRLNIYDIVMLCSTLDITIGRFFNEFVEVVELEG